MNKTFQSLPDLHTTKQFFTGIEGRSQWSTTQDLRPGLRQKPEVKGLYQVICAYMRCRQRVWDQQAANQRIPRMLSSELHRLEIESGIGLRNLNSALFQRFDDKQALRLLRSVPIMNFSKDDWLFTRDPKEENDPPQPEYYLLVHGIVDLYERSPRVCADPVRMYPGAVFAEGGWPQEGSTIQMRGAGAQAMTTVLCVVFTKEYAGLACNDDRYIANKKYSQYVEKFPILEDVRQDRTLKLLKMAQVFNVPANSDLLTWPQIADSFLIMTEGTFEWCADVNLLEIQNPEQEKSRRKINIFVEAGIGLVGSSYFDKLDPYLICRLSPQKRFQTRTHHNAGKEPYFNHNGVLVYDGEVGLEFIVYDYNDVSAHDVIGTGFVPASDFTGTGGFEGEVQLIKPPTQSIWGTKKKENESAGLLLVMVTWGDVLGFRSVTKHKEPRQRSWPRVPLIELPSYGMTRGPNGGMIIAPGKTDFPCFGHEQILLGDVFYDNLNGATRALGFELTLTNFCIQAKAEGARLSKSSCLRLPKESFLSYLRRNAKEKDFRTAAVNSSCDKQVKIQGVCYTLIAKWNDEDRRREQQKTLGQPDPSTLGIDVGAIRTMLRGALLHVRVQSAVGLGGGSKFSFDKLDPYLVIKIVGTNQVVTSDVYEDAGADPQFDFECRFRYGGETVLQIQVFDKDRFTRDEEIGVTSLSIEQFHDGFVGALEIKRPASLVKSAGSAGLMNVSIEWSDIKGADH